MSVRCRFQVNGMAVELEVQPGARLLDVLRGPLGLPGTKEGCGNGECGACTVIVDGRAVNACLFPALEADGTTITTIEGLAAPGGKLSAVQQSFVTEGGIQCGFCTPGMVMSVTALLSSTTSPTDDQIRDALVGNLCRCTGYKQIVQAVHAAAATLRRLPTRSGGPSDSERGTEVPRGKGGPGGARERGAGGEAQPPRERGQA